MSGHNSFALYWHMRHLAKPDVPCLTIEELEQRLGIPHEIVDANTECLTPEGARSEEVKEPVCPGRLIQAALNHVEWTQSELAHMMGLSRSLMNLMIHGQRTISAAQALEFEKLLGIPAHVLLRLQADYELYNLLKSL